MTEEHHVAHPTPAQYIKIAVGLAILTAVEVALFYINNSLDLGWINTAALLILAFLKFVIVIGWYMHIRYEKSDCQPVLRFRFRARFVALCRGPDRVRGAGRQSLMANCP